MREVDRLVTALANVETVRAYGHVRALVGLAMRASIPDARHGDLVEIARSVGEPLLAEVVGFERDEAMLMPLGDARGVGPDDRVRVIGHGLEVACGDGALGRVLDGLGRPIDDKGPISGEMRPIRASAPNPMTRPRIGRPLPLGIRAIDGLMTVGEGQRIGLFAGSGVGKSTLLGQIARQADADVFVVCLVGERGREVREFLEDALGEEGRARGVVVCATSDAPALVRMTSVFVATTIAEHFRDRGKRVVLLVDSVTRFARAAREVGLAAGEPPARRGYPPSAFAALPTLLERSGTSERGSITAFYTVLVEGGDLEEPVADEVRGILDGHIVLDRALAARGRFPAIDVVTSLSRVMPAVASPSHCDRARKVRELVALYESKRDLVLLGAYKAGTDPRLDAALAAVPRIDAFLSQKSDERCDFAAMERALGALS